jgi:alpha-glucosidase
MLGDRILSTLLLAMLFGLGPLSHAQDVDALGHPWWKHAVFYELYPRSFADSDNNGTGDLIGIASRLDYLKGLGVDAIWITPFYPSPQVDFGYDISDFENIDPMYGTMADFDQLQVKAKQRGMRIVLDFVLNHTSDQHPWFVDARSSPRALHRDWYIWRDGRGPGQPPNNWRSDFGGPAWKLDPASGKYYYHTFAPEQPDLNWRNPAVAEAMFDVTRFWYKRGVSGFRLDAVDYLFEDPKLQDNPILPGKNERGEPNMQDKYNSKLPEIHDALRSLRRVADQSHAVLVGETYTDDANELKKYYGAHDDEIQLPMNFVFCSIDKLSAPEFRKQIAAAEATGEWPVYVIGNHDMPRSYVRYGDGQHNDQIAKLMAALYLTLRGTAVMYYGEELGMENNDPKRLEDVKDPAGKTGGWPENKGRDGERTPMQWNDSPNAGFTQGTPWLLVSDSYKTHNVAVESADPHSILQFYRRLLALRHQDEALLEGDYLDLKPKNESVLAYLRRSGKEQILVVLNMSGNVQTVNLGLAGHKTTLLCSPCAPHFTGSSVTLQPFAVYIARLSR